MQVIQMIMEELGSVLQDRLLVKKQIIVNNDDKPYPQP